MPDKMTNTIIEDFKNKYTAIKNLTFKTDILPLDLLIAGGLKQGRIYEIYSAAGLGKTTLALQICKNLINNYEDYNIFYVDADASADELITKYKLNEKTNNFTCFNKIKTYEELDEITDSIISNENLNIKLLIIDPITMITSSSFLEKPILNNDYEESKLATKYFKKYKSLFYSKGITVILLNQIREDIGKFIQFAEQKTRPAGPKIITYAPNVIIELNEGIAMTESKHLLDGRSQDIKIGFYMKLNAKKNKLADAHITLETPFMYGNGIMNHLFLTKLLEKCDYISHEKAQKTNYKTNILGKDDSFSGRTELHKWVKDNYKLLYDFLKNEGGLNLIKTKFKKKTSN